MGNWAGAALRHAPAGCQTLWTFHRLLSPVDGGWGEMYRSVHDPLVSLGYLAAVTERIRLGAAAVNLPYRAPVVLAKQLATVDVLSGGRLDAGLGIGWSDEEFAATGADRGTRGRQADEAIPLLRRLWAGGSAAAGPTLSEVGDAIGLIRAAAVEAGRDPAALRFVCRRVVRVRPAAATADRPPLTGTLEQIRADFDEFAARAVTERFVDLNFDPEIGSPDADPAESLRRVDEALTAFAPDGLPGYR